MITTAALGCIAPASEQMLNIFLYRALQRSREVMMYQCNPSVKACSISLWCDHPHHPISYFLIYLRFSETDTVVFWRPLFYFTDVIGVFLVTLACCEGRLWCTAGMGSLWVQLKVSVSFGLGIRLLRLTADSTHCRQIALNKQLNSKCVCNSSLQLLNMYLSRKTPLPRIAGVVR